MTAPSEGFRNLLTTWVAASGWALHTGSMPDTPDRVTLITDSGGFPPNPKWLLDYPSVQVMVRGLVGAYIATRTEAVAVKDILLGIPGQVLLSDRWVSVTMAGDIGFIGRDQEERPLFSMNFNLIIQPAASTETSRLALV